MAGEPVQFHVDLEEAVSQFSPAMGLPGGDVEAGRDPVDLERAIQLDRPRRGDPDIFPPTRIRVDVFTFQMSFRGEFSQYVWMGASFCQGLPRN